MDNNGLDDSEQFSQSESESKSNNQRPMWKTISSLRCQIMKLFHESRDQESKPKIVGDRVSEAEDEAEEWVFWYGRLQTVDTLTIRLGPDLIAESINALPVVNITQEMVIQGVLCPLCQEKFTVNDEVKKLECNHLFHPLCFPRTLYPEDVCPLCTEEESGWTDWSKGETEEVTDDITEEDLVDEEEEHVGDGFYV